MDEHGVADFLLKKKFYLAALELHQELLEGNNGVHSVAALNKFFGDAAGYASLLRQVEGDRETNNKNGECFVCLFFMYYPAALQRTFHHKYAADALVPLSKYEASGDSCAGMQFQPRNLVGSLCLFVNVLFIPK